MDEDTRAIVPLDSTALAEEEAAGEIAVHPPEQMAGAVGKVMDLIAERLKLETPHPSTARRVRGARTISRDFILSMIAAAERRPDFPFIGEFDSAEAREVMESADAYRQISERTTMFLASLNYTIEARWAKVVASAMHKFSMASVVAEFPQNAELAAEIENLRRQLGRKGKGGPKKKAAKKTGEKPE